MCDLFFKYAQTYGQWDNLKFILSFTDAEEVERVLGKMGDTLFRKKFPSNTEGMPDLAPAVVQAVCDAMKKHCGHNGVAKKGLRMLHRMQTRRLSKGTHDEIVAVQDALLIHGFIDMAVQHNARGILKQWDRLGLSDPQSMSVYEALAEAKEFQAQPASAIKYPTLVDCLARLRHNAKWEIMTKEQQKSLQPQVAEFVLWVMKNFPPDTAENRYVGEKACRVLFNMVAGSMQDDNKKLYGTSLSYLVNLNVGPLWTLFSSDSVSDDVDFEWLAQRLVCAPVEQKKRVREADDSA